MWPILQFPADLVTFAGEILNGKLQFLCIDYKEFIKNIKSILKMQKRIKSERHNVFSEDINKIALSSNDDKRMQSIDLIERYEQGTSKDLLSDKQEIKCNNMIKWHKKWLTLMML